MCLLVLFASLVVDSSRTYWILYSMQNVSFFKMIGTTASDKLLDEIPAAVYPEKLFGTEADKLARTPGGKLNGELKLMKRRKF